MKQNYSRFQLIRYIIVDLISDIRSSKEGQYKRECLVKVQTLFAHRHKARTDQFGQPIGFDI